MDSQRSVLIVDSSEETREVLETALRRLGVQTFAASRVQTGIELARQHHPDLVVLDLELEQSPAEDSAAPLAEQAASDRAPLVLLGSVRRTGRYTEGEFVAKPYHYGPLIRKIEELLGNRS